MDNSLIRAILKHMENPNFFDRPIAITDVEFTGLDPDIHEIIEIGLVVVDQHTLEIIDTLDMKVKPEHPETGTEEAQKVTGYTDAEWADAPSLKEGLELFAQKTQGAIFCAQTINNDWAFLSAGFKKTGVQHTMDYHMVDIPSIAWEKLRNTGIPGVRLRLLSEFFKIPVEPAIHRAFNGAMSGYYVLKALLEYKK